MQRLGKGVKHARIGMSIKNTVPASHSVIACIAPYFAVLVNMPGAKSGKFDPLCLAAAGR